MFVAYSSIEALAMRIAALPLSSEGSPAQSGGLYMRMRSWLSAAGPVTRQCAKALLFAEQASASAEVSRSADATRSTERAAKSMCGTVIAFPLRAQARLNQLAQELKQFFLDLGVDDYRPLMLRVVGGVEPQMWIDSASYVQFRGEQGGYHVVFDDAFETRLTFETTEIEDVSRMVRAYIVARLADAYRAQGALA